MTHGRPGWLAVAGALPPAGVRAAPLLSASLLVLSFPPFHLILAPFVALVPFLTAVEALPPGPAGRRAATGAGWLLGTACYAALLYWLLPALLATSALAVPGFLAVVLVLAGFTAAFAAGLHALRASRPAVPLPLAAAILWTALEWAQAHLGPLSFPWLGLGTALAQAPRLAAAADLVGARGLAVALVLVNGCGASAIIAARRGRWAAALRPALGGLALVAALAAYGAWREATLRLVPAARVAVVQPNVPAAVKADPGRAVPVSLSALSRLTAALPRGTADLVVWPETALPAALEDPAAHGIRDRLRALAAQVGARILVGGYGRAAGGGRTNAAFLVAPGGVLPRTYAKHRLVPFVERVPFTGGAGGLVPGSGDPGYRAGGSRFGVLICFESAFADRARAERRAGALFLVNITNDDWSTGPAREARTSAFWQHPAHLVLRAIETRSGIARAANTGFSLFVDPLGRVHDRTRLFREAVAVDTVWTTPGATPFVRWGDLTGSGAAILAVLLLAAAEWPEGAGKPPGRRRLRPSGSPSIFRARRRPGRSDASERQPRPAPIQERSWQSATRSPSPSR